MGPGAGGVASCSADMGGRWGLWTNGCDGTGGLSASNGGQSQDRAVNHPWRLRGLHLSGAVEGARPAEMEPKEATAPWTRQTCDLLMTTVQRLPPFNQGVLCRRGLSPWPSLEDGS